MTGALARSAETITTTLRRLFAADSVASDGFLQRRDPRVALLSITGLALAVMIARSLAVTLAFGALTLALARLSAVPIRRLLARSAVVPLASGLIVLPQAVLLSGSPLVEVLGISVTVAGLEYVVVFVLRVGVGVALLSLLVLTTPFSVLVAALRDLRIPVALVWVLAITYRYLFLFFDELRRLLWARNSRTTGGDGLGDGWRDARRLSGTFLLRAIDRSERVGRGMRARGGARAPSPYGRRRSLDAFDYCLAGTALGAVLTAGVVQWLP